MKIKGFRFGTWVFVLGAFIVIVAGIWLAITRLEGTPPTVVVTPEKVALGASQEITVTATDNKTGLRKVRVVLAKDGKEAVLFQKDYPSGVLTVGAARTRDTFSVKIEPKQLGISDGKAVLQLTVWDNAWRGWFHGNKADIKKNVVVDTVAPRIRVMSRFHNIAQGGSGLVIYSLTEPCPSSGVQVGENFFPGYAGYFSDKSIYMAFFALEYSQGPGTEFYISAVDAAGNSARSGFPHYIRKRAFKKDNIRITDQFLNLKMPEFEIPGGGGADLSAVEKFLKINRELRQTNYGQIVRETTATQPEIMWSGSFLRLPNSARQAGFADYRTYLYKGHVIDHETHMGIDLAATAHTEVPAANGGRIAFVGDLGIYGRTVIIDHGFGLFSMYSHLSGAAVQRGQEVARGTVIGHTGMTGLAGGDHLHFSMLIQQTFVDPIEWWDGAWIKNNVTDKIASVKTAYGVQ